MRILVDCDGVLADFVGGICFELSRMGIEKKPSDFRHWDLAESLTTYEAKLVREIMRRPGFCESLEWYQGAFEMIQLAQKEHEMYVVTAPFESSETWERERKAWLEAFVPRTRILSISGESKHLVRGDLLIEDHPGTCRAWLEENPQGRAVLIDRPWNQRTAKEFKNHPRMTRAHLLGALPCDCPLASNRRASHPAA